MNDLSPVVHQVVVKMAPPEAFELFTRGMGRWWPFNGHSCGGEQSVDVQFEPRLGGAVTEVERNGTRHPWGLLTEWSPPHGLAMTWHPAQPQSHATKLEVRFKAVPEGCEVRVEHSGWAARGADAAEIRGGYHHGWALVLGEYAAQAAKEA